VKKNTKWRRVAAPHLTSLQDGAFVEHLEGGATYTHWLNQDMEF
jgi:hypothetical protein